MLHFLPSVVIGCLAVTVFALNTLFWGSLLVPVALVKWIVPHRGVRERCTHALVWIAEAWIDGNNANMWLTQRTEWDFQVDGHLERDGSYLVVSNHRSAVDIPVLQRVFNRKIPLLRFFLKKQLIYVPVLGFAWWALDFPFMHRDSREAVRKRPELRGRDLENVRRACQKLRGRPVSILNYLEGTRFTPVKHQQQHSPYRHLLTPRAGGIAGVLSTMGHELDGILDVTLLYADRRTRFWDFFCGRLRRIVVRARLLPVPEGVVGQDYGNDPLFRQKFQGWVNRLWHEKDEQLERLGATAPRPPRPPYPSPAGEG